MSVNKGFEDDIELQEADKSMDLPHNSHDYEDVNIEKKSIQDSDSDSIVPVKKTEDREELIHDGPYAGMGKEELLRYSRGFSWRAARWVLLLILLAGWCAMLGMSIYIIVVTPRCLPWWQTSVIYQIYPRSFKDSDGDGIGDLKGIIEKVDYLSDIGVGAVLLHSIYQSPQRDLGYDVSDFEKVDPIFGSQEDFDALITALHDKNIKVILDFIPNHSSVEHEFFQKSSARDETYLNWYTWADNSNNWVSVYSGSAWRLKSERAQHYLHQFSEYQPDLNLRKEAVTNYLETVLEQWFIKGVDGFSIQGVKYMFETDAYTDDTPAPGYVNDGLGDPVQYESLLHDKSSEFDGLQHVLLKKWRKGIFDQFSTAGTYRVMITDSDSNSSYARTYYGTEEDPEVDLPMNLNLVNLGDVNGGWSGTTIGTGYTTGLEVYEMVQEWMDNLPKGKWPSFMLGHHGVHRIASRLTKEHAGAANMLLLTLPGTPICYYGDEIGMTDVLITEDELMDIKALNDMPRWEIKTRDRQRTPMQWTADPYAGFTSSVNGSWLPVPPEEEFTKVNVAVMDEDPNSVLRMFKALTKLRAEKRTLRQGPTAKFVHNTLNVVSYIRELEGERERFFVAINFGQDTTFENDFFDRANGALPVEGTVVVGTDMSRVGERVQLNKIALRVGEGILVLLDEIVEVQDQNWWYQYFRPANLTPKAKGECAYIIHMELTFATCVAIFLCVLTPSFAAGFGPDEWWKNTIIYQIYPRSFMDSDGDGVGDLDGITSRLEHFNDLGVGTVWLSPVYKSPMADFGYDVADFKDIDPIFGTMADFDELITKAHRLGLKLMMDFVPNHSSDQHAWFLESKKNKDTSNPYKDYYMWEDPKQGCSPVEECVPNNWVSLFGGSMWEWVPERQQFYLHQFLKEQPDLNYRNPQVRAAMDDVVRFWLEKGVDGMRVDAIRHMYENEDLQDEPPNPDYTPVPGEQAQYDSLLHTKTVDLPELHDVIKNWRQIFNEFGNDAGYPQYRFMVTETYDTHKGLLPYYGTPDQPEADFPFNFGMIELTKENLSGNKIYDFVNDWMKDLPTGKWPNWVIGNHDNFRIADRIGVNYARALNVLNLLLPGTPTTYYGEEIVMEDIWVPYNETQDPYAINNPSHWQNYTRDPERSPMQWDWSPPHAGFSTTAGKTWLPVNDNYLSGVNVADQKADDTSALKLYARLATLRKEEPAFQTNHLDYVIVNEKIFSFLRTPDTAGRDSFLVIINAGTSDSTEDYSAALRGMMIQVEDDTGVIAASSKMDRNGEPQGMNKISAAVGEALVIRAKVYAYNAASQPSSSLFIALATIIAIIFRHVIFKY
ncbi:uncharacterized protein LOC110979322 [Acanthaster planci]|uniref:Uncharacterized protein LOC110979322 n=1 Tax=Acanthaster planci TaxID=133434 RepID=A0A8B7YDR4_ACAPL|nr:uncharacterized protein LOC110979322 [Acanthaster planci]